MTEQRRSAVVISLEMLAYYQSLEDATDLAEADHITAEGRAKVPHAEVGGTSYSDCLSNTPGSANVPQVAPLRNNAL